MKISESKMLEMDALYVEFCNANGIVMDSQNDHEDYALRGHAFASRDSL